MGKADIMVDFKLTTEEVVKLNARFESEHPAKILRWAVDTFRPDIALTSSFGADSAALLHMAVSVEPRLSIRFIDTGFHFPETLSYMEELKRRLNLNLSIFRTKMDVERFKREHAHLPIEHPDYCCGEYKVEATKRALEGLRCWISGISRSDSPARSQTPIVEVLTTGLVKVSPLAAWSLKQIHAYMSKHNLPYHPLWYQGYTSIGCYPCTQKPIDPNDPRSGRWVGRKDKECGIHDIGKQKGSSS